MSEVCPMWSQTADSTRSRVRCLPLTADCITERSHNQYRNVQLAASLSDSATLLTQPLALLVQQYYLYSNVLPSQFHSPGYRQLAKHVTARPSYRCTCGRCFELHLNPVNHKYSTYHVGAYPEILYEQLNLSMQVGSFKNFS